MARLRGYSKPEEQGEQASEEAKIEEQVPALEDENQSEEFIKEEVFEPVSRITAQPQETAIKNEPLTEVDIKRDLALKYSDVDEAVSSICSIGEYYEDIDRADRAGLTKAKEFVLCVLAQNPNRYNCSQINKPYEWVDEEFLTVEAARFFAENKEGINPDYVEAFSKTLYSFLSKYSFAYSAYETLNEVFKRVARVNSASIASGEDALRMSEALKRFKEAVTEALAKAKASFEQVKQAQLDKAKALQNKKQELKEQIEAMSF